MDHDLTPGRWAMVRGNTDLDVEVWPIARLDGRRWIDDCCRARQKHSILMTFATREEAWAMKNHLDGIKGEYLRRHRAAHAWATGKFDEILNG